MLVLSRKEGEVVVIDTPSGQITVQVCTLDRGKVRLGITADRNIPIHRLEVLRKLKASGNGRAEQGG